MVEVEEGEDDGTFVVGRELPRLASVRALPGPHPDLEVTWREGEGPPGPRRVDVSPLIDKYRVFAPLRDDPEAFAKVRLLDWGTRVSWDADGEGDMDTSADALEHLGRQTMSTGDFPRWRESLGLSLSGAAAALGLSRRKVAYYDSGERVPRVVCLACRCLSVTARELDLRDRTEPPPGFDGWAPQAARTGSGTE